MRIQAARLPFVVALLAVAGCASDAVASHSGNSVGGGQSAKDAGSGNGSAGSSNFGNSNGNGGSNAGGLKDASTSGDGCASAELVTMRVVPTVWLLVDGSGSMATALDGVAGPSRWSVLRDALTSTTGLVPRLQASVAFGLYVYDGGTSLPGGPPGPSCPRVVEVDPTLGNAAALTAAYPVAQLGASTPTHYALLDLQKRIAAAPSTLGPTYIVLATDGKPNLCDFHDGVPATEATEQEAVATVMQLAAAGTKSFVISMAGGDAALQTHLEAVAMAGGTGTPPFTPTTKDDLAAALMSIIGAAATCDVRIQGHVEAGRQCTGKVELDGVPLGCNDANGYRLKADRQTLEVLGSSCTALQNKPTATLKATFPCGAVTVF